MAAQLQNYVLLCCGVHVHLPLTMFPLDHKNGCPDPNTFADQRSRSLHVGDRHSCCRNASCHELLLDIVAERTRYRIIPYQDLKRSDPIPLYRPDQNENFFGGMPTLKSVLVSMRHRKYLFCLKVWTR
nr:hypothetical protein CFP56_58227 [Quercus suber]